MYADSMLGEMMISEGVKPSSRHCRRALVRLSAGVSWLAAALINGSVLKSFAVAPSLALGLSGETRRTSGVSSTFIFLMPVPLGANSAYVIIRSSFLCMKSSMSLNCGCVSPKKRRSGFSCFNSFTALLICVDISSHSRYPMRRELYMAL